MENMSSTLTSFHHIRNEHRKLKFGLVPSHTLNVMCKNHTQCSQARLQLSQLELDPLKENGIKYDFPLEIRFHRLLHSAQNPKLWSEFQISYKAAAWVWYTAGRIL